MYGPLPAGIIPSPCRDPEEILKQIEQIGYHTGERNEGNSRVIVAEPGVDIDPKAPPGPNRFRQMVRIDGTDEAAAQTDAFSAQAVVPPRALNEILKARDLAAVEAEFNRTLSRLRQTRRRLSPRHVRSVESLKPLWTVVSRHLGLDAASLVNYDLKRILSGLSSIVDGIGALRMHAGSAHGRGRAGYRIEPRHARLAVHSAHTLAVFVFETWDHCNMNKP